MTNASTCPGWKSAAVAATLFCGAIVGGAMSGCAFSAPDAAPPMPDRADFDALVYPVLMRDCGFPACHGSPGRFFRIYGVGRTRLDTTTTPLASEEELEASYHRTRSMLASSGRPEDSLLLRKPLEVDQGGAPHMGIDIHGRDVYGSEDAAGYLTLLEWARGDAP